MLDDPAIDGAVSLLSILAHPVRLRVVLRLHQDGAESVGELARLTATEQSAMSHHLRLLRDARLVVTERRGKEVLYALADDHVGRIARAAVLHAAERTGEP